MADQEKKAPEPKKEVVNISCRANGRGCGGQQAVIAYKSEKHWLHGGGTTLRYQCVDCNGIFEVTL